MLMILRGDIFMKTNLFKIKHCNLFLIGGVIVLALSLIGCNSITDNRKQMSSSPEEVIRQNIEIMRRENYSEQNITMLIEALRQCEDPVGLGKEQVIKTGTVIQDFHLPGAGNYSEEYLWFITDAGNEYYAFVDKESSAVRFVCKGDLEDREYIWRSYQ